MIKFNELRVAKDGKSLIIDVSVRDLPYYDNVYIDKVAIDTQDTFISSGISSHPVFSKTVSGNNKSVRLELSSADMVTDFTKNLFFVYVVTKGTPTADVPCNMDEKTTLCVTLWEYPLYNTLMQSIKDLEHNCEIPKNFIDIMLKFKAFEIAINTGNYNQAIIYYNRYIKNIESVITKSNKCNCYG